MKQCVECKFRFVVEITKPDKYIFDDRQSRREIVMKNTYYIAIDD